MNIDNRVGRKALRVLLVRSAIHANTARIEHLAGHRRTVIIMLATLVYLFCIGMAFKEQQLGLEVMAIEARQLPIARESIQVVASQEAELKALRKIAEATKSAKPNVIYIDRQTVKGKVLDAVVQNFGPEHVDATEKLLGGESGFQPWIANQSSKACGIFQFINCAGRGGVVYFNNAMNKWVLDVSTFTVEQQIAEGMKYIKNRYGNPTKAWQFWLARVPVGGKDLGNWY